MALRLNQLTNHVYWLPPEESTDRPVLGAIAGSTGTLLVDAGNSPAHAGLFLAELDRHKLPPPKFLALTHWHWDHVFGTAAIPLPTVSSAETKQIVEEMARLDWSDEALDRRVEAGTEIAFCRDMIKAELPDRSELVIRPPDIGFTSQVTVELGEITVQIVHVGGDHAPDSSIVYVPQEKILFLGDCLGPDLYQQPPVYTSRRLFPLLDCLLAYDVTFYLAGHETEPVSRAALESLASLLRTIGQIVDQTGNDRARVLLRTEETIDEPLNEDHAEIADAFLAGLGTS